LGRQALDSATIALRLPKRIDGLVTRIEDGSIAVANPGLERRVIRLEHAARRLVSALVFGALLIAGALVRSDDTVFGTVLMAISAVPLLHALFSGRRAG
jgi:hypothetical protein